MSKKIIYIFLFLIYHVIKSESVVIDSNTDVGHVITVFIHGTSIARRMMNISPFRPNIYCPQGLTLAKELPEEYRYHQIAKSCSKLNSKRYPFDNFYIFGWRSESFNHRVRMKAAANLMESLQKVVTEYYEKNKILPYVRIIGFSHGGKKIQLFMQCSTCSMLFIVSFLTQPVCSENWLILIILLLASSLSKLRNSGYPTNFISG
jgi:hypothetical protein